MKITENIFESLASRGSQPAVIELASGGTARCMQARDLSSQISESRNFLLSCGIRKGGCVILFLDNSIDFILLFLSLVDIGAKPVPVNVAFRTIELDEVFTNADPHGVIAESHYLETVRPYAGNIMIIERHKGRFLVHHPSRPATERSLDIDDSIATINYTYRGHGYPLGAMIPHEQYRQGAEALVRGLDPREGEKMLVLLPFFYIFPLVGCLFAPLLYGMTLVLSPTVNPVHNFDYIRTHGINIVTAVPEIYEMFYNLHDGSVELPSLSVFVSGGSSLAHEACECIQHAFHVQMLHGYGLTEFTPVSRNMRNNGRPGTIGPVCDGVDCRIMPGDETGTGEISVRASGMARGYYRRPAETAEAFENGWFKTGDNGRFEDGHLIYMGEKKKTRKIKGNLVDLEEVRRALKLHPKVRDADVRCERTLSARIGIDNTKNCDEEIRHIKEFLESRIARYKIPRDIACE